MSGREYISTSEAGQICGVARTTITRWIDEGSLKAFRTPGGHRKIRKEDMADFLVTKNGKLGDGSDSLTRILIVDDNYDDVRFLEAAFLASQDKYRVHTAHDGFEAIYKIGEVRPDIVILDLMMPEIDGFEVCSRIKSSEFSKHIKVIVTTACDDDEKKQRALSCGADAFFGKPLDWRALVQKILELSMLPVFGLFLR